MCFSHVELNGSLGIDVVMIFLLIDLTTTSLKTKSILEEHDEEIT